ncbi:MAG: class I SAM-dependent RNA methyltransferase [Bacilli bacterium]
MIVKIDKLSHDMRGITRIDNKVTFIDNTLPGEIVNIKLTKQKKDINEGNVLSFVEQSLDRVEPICPYYNVCGGCNISHIDYLKSVIYKKEIVKDIIKKYSDLDINPDIIYDNNIYNYRNKITLKINNGKLSLVGENKVNIDYCYLVNDNINKVIQLLNGTHLGLLDEVIIKGTNEIMVIINGTVDEKEVIDILRDDVTSIIVNDNKIYGKDYITIKVRDYIYAIYPNSFFQVNTGMISKLYDKVLEYAGDGKLLLDLYCGAGTIGIYLSQNFSSIIGIEVNKDAVTSANINKKINDINNIEFICSKSSDIEIVGDVLIVDPPRNGLDKITINKIINSSIKKIVYVSCNPITLARDLKVLKEKYELDQITLFDMFPNTNHVECVCLLKLK